MLPSHVKRGMLARAHIQVVGLTSAYDYHVSGLRNSLSRGTAVRGMVLASPAKRGQAGSGITQPALCKFAVVSMWILG